MRINELLELTSWRAFDVDDAGRVLTGCDESGSMQLVEISPDGSTKALTRLEGACTGRYLPGERTVVVTHDQGGNERAQLSLLRPENVTEPLTELEPLVHDPRYIHSLAEVLPGRIVYRTNRRNGVDFDIVVRDMSSGAEEVHYSAGGWAGDPALHSDGKRLALTRPGIIAMSDQLLLADDSGITELTPAELPAQHRTISWLDDSLILTTNRGQEFTGIARFDIKNHSWDWLVNDLEHDLIGWPSPDGTRMLVHTNVNGTSLLTMHSSAGEPLGGGREDPTPQQIELPELGWLAFPMPEPIWSANSRYVAITFTTPTNPGDILLLDTQTQHLRAVTPSNRNLPAKSEPVAYWVPGEGGDIPIHFYPATAVPGLEGAAVVLVHGGPESQSVGNFNPVIQGLCAAGFTVLVPNVRGSTGYGKSWYSADDKRQRLNSVDDLAALHAYLPELGLDRAALWGGSYGGYMVLAGLAFQPELWKSGVDIVGMSSLVTFLENTSEYRRTQRMREYGTLAEDREFLETASPLNKIDQIRAPLFVIHGANDPRVPLSEAEQLTTELDSRGVPCELHVYHDEGHGLAKRANRLDAYPQAIKFLTTHLTR